MDHNKINYDLIVAVLEWIVGNDHEVISLHCMCITLYVYYIVCVLHCMCITKIQNILKFFQFSQAFLTW